MEQFSEANAKKHPETSMTFWDLWKACGMLRLRLLQQMFKVLWVAPPQQTRPSTKDTASIKSPTGLSCFWGIELNILTVTKTLFLKQGSIVSHWVVTTNSHKLPKLLPPAGHYAGLRNCLHFLDLNAAFIFYIQSVSNRSLNWFMVSSSSTMVFISLECHFSYAYPSPHTTPPFQHAKLQAPHLCQ